jgi:hypothetical protein
MLSHRKRLTNMNEDLKEIRNAAQNIAIGVGEDLIKVSRKYTEFLAAVDPKFTGGQLPKLHSGPFFFCFLSFVSLAELRLESETSHFSNYM